MKALLYLPFLLVLFFSDTNSEVAQSHFLVEICDNAVDDDNDGLIDLNDPDCVCAIATPQSLIPNPSFEEQNCCPSGRSQLHCAKDWIQASDATTDYMHSCGWTSRSEFPVPQPIPDGKGFVGWRNGSVGNANFKEYSGACLKGPLKAGISYRFEFWVGFTNAINSPPTSIVFFGTPNCINLPFGRGNTQFGCPTNGPGWIELGSVPINGINEWKLYEITVIPTIDIYAIAIGPNCLAVSSSVNFYYFFDNLVLAAQSEFAFNIQPYGHPCSGAMLLSVTNRDTLGYQWYRNGIALTGKTSAIMDGVTLEGNYQVRISGPTTCFVSNPYSLKIPSYTGKTSRTVCYGETYFFDNKNLNKTGIYYDTLRTADRCDSIVQLDLNILSYISDTVQALIFEGESYEVGSKSYSAPGIYKNLLSSWNGCDSLVILDLDYFKFYFPNAFSPNGDGLNDKFCIRAPKGIAEISKMLVFDRWGGLKYEAKGLPPNDPDAGWNGDWKGISAQPGVYIYLAYLQFDDGRTKVVSGSLTLLR